MQKRPPIPTEDQLADWQMEDFLDHARDGISQFASDKQELFIRRDVLVTLQAHGQKSPVVREAVMLSLLGGIWRPRQTLLVGSKMRVTRGWDTMPIAI